jgi:hypothetical protein
MILIPVDWICEYGDINDIFTFKLHFFYLIYYLNGKPTKSQ